MNATKDIYFGSGYQTLVPLTMCIDCSKSSTNCSRELLLYVVFGTRKSIGIQPAQVH